MILLPSSADVIGFFARDPETLKKAASVFLQNTSPKFKRILSPKNLHELTEANYAAAVTQEAKRLAKARGLQLVESDVDDLLSWEVRDLFARTQSREI